MWLFVSEVELDFAPPLLPSPAPEVVFKEEIQFAPLQGDFSLHYAIDSVAKQDTVMPLFHLFHTDCSVQKFALFQLNLFIFYFGVLLIMSRAVRCAEQQSVRESEAATTTVEPIQIKVDEKVSKASV